MKSLILLQFSEHVAAKSADIAIRDPHGAIITLVSVFVVFSALTILYFAYTFIGKMSSGSINLKKTFIPTAKKYGKALKQTPSEEEAAAIALAIDQELNGEIYAAIGMALHQYLNDTVHDNESYIITIKRK